MKFLIVFLFLTISLTSKDTEDVWEDIYKKCFKSEGVDNDLRYFMSISNYDKPGSIYSSKSPWYNFGGWFGKANITTMYNYDFLRANYSYPKANLNENSTICESSISLDKDQTLKLLFETINNIGSEEKNPDKIKKLNKLKVDFLSSLKSNSESKFNIVSSGRDKFDTGPFIQFVQNSSTDIKLLNTLLGKDILLVKEAIWVKSFEYRSKLDESTKTALNVFMNSNAAILGEYKLDIKFESISGITEDVVIKFKLENKSYPIVLFEAYNLELSTNGIDIKEKGTHSIDEFSFKLKKIDNEEYVKRIQLDN